MIIDVKPISVYIGALIIGLFQAVGFFIMGLILNRTFKKKIK